MYSRPHSVSALALLTIDLIGQYSPASPPGGATEFKTLAGFGVLIHWICDDASLAFRLETGVTGHSTTGREMVDQLEDALTGVGILASYDLYGCALPLIAEVAAPRKQVGLTALATAAAETLCDLIEPTGPSGPAGHEPFEMAAGKRGIATVPAAVVARLQWWAPLFEDHATAILAGQAIATWRLWLHRHVEETGDAVWGDAALAQLEHWLETDPLALLDRRGQRIPVATVATAAATVVDTGMD